MPVNAYPNGASPYDCEQMSGNVGEWTHTLWASYPYAFDKQHEDEKSKSIKTRVVRGGTFHCDTRLLRCARRSLYGYVPYFPDICRDDCGFRICVAPEIKV